MLIEVDAPTLMCDGTVTVSLKRWTRTRIQLWLMVRLLRLAAWVGGAGIEVVKTNGNSALELWHQWFSEDGDCQIEGYGTCFFCLMHPDEGHAPDCIYIAAKKLVEGAE